MIIKWHKVMVLSRRRRSDARQKFSPCDFSFANSCRQIHIFCAKFIISSHLATMAIGSANPVITILCTKNCFIWSYAMKLVRKLKLAECDINNCKDIFSRPNWPSPGWENFNRNRIWGCNLIPNFCSEQTSIVFREMDVPPNTQRGMCIKGLFWPPLEPKTKNCFSPISFH